MKFIVPHSALVSFSFALFALFFQGCSSSSSVPDERYGRDARIAFPTSSTGKSAETGNRIERPPWETFSYGKDLEGAPISNRNLLQADELLRSGDFSSALERLEAIDVLKLNEGEKRARAYRMASVLLVLGRSRESLHVLSRFFKERGIRESDVEAQFAVLFGFAFGEQGDIDQSLAWFSRAANPKSSGPSVHGTAESGVQLLLRTIEQERFEKVARAWEGDFFIQTLIGQERRRRAAPGSNVIVSARPFWSVMHADSQRLQSHNPDGRILSGRDSHAIGVVLPLSGPYASLGLSLKNGIELAVEGLRAESAMEPPLVQVLDDAGDAVQASARVRELANQGGVNLVLGPLLSEAAERASEVARQEAIPMLTFSKSSAFSPGNGVFRFGPTAVDQAASLVELAHRQLGISRFASVYPDDAGGLEFGAAFRDAVSARGLSLSFEAAYPRGDMSGFLVLAGEVERSGAGAVFFPDNLRAAARFFSYLSGPAGPRVRPLGSVAWDSPNELQQSRAVLSGAVFVSPFFVRSSRLEVQRFQDAYRARFQSAPDFMAAQGFDAATIVLEALGRARSEGVGVAEAIRGLQHYRGITGEVHVHPNGEMRRQFEVLAFEEGVVREIVNTGQGVGEQIAGGQSAPVSIDEH